VLSVSIIENFSGHVYNLETKNNWYVANNIIIHNCRCLYLPEIKGLEGFDDDDERASVDGPVSANMSYEDWLKTQDDDVVKDILGATRFGLYKSGVPISSFITDGRTLTLDQLAEKEGITLAMPGYNEVDLKNIPDAIKIDRGVIDYTNLSYDDAIHKEGKWLFEQGDKRGNEFSSLVTKDKRILGTWEGFGKYTHISDDDVRNVTKGISSYDNLHCHLDGSFFSDKDMFALYNNRKLGSVMISMPDDSVYYLKLKPDSIRHINEKSLNFTWGYNETKYTKELMKKYNVNTLLPEQYAEATMKIVEKMAYIFNWDFGKI
jgi:hypothetical protein